MLSALPRDVFLRCSGGGQLHPPRNFSLQDRPAFSWLPSTDPGRPEDWVRARLEELLEVVPTELRPSDFPWGIDALVESCRQEYLRQNFLGPLGERKPQASPDPCGDAPAASIWARLVSPKNSSGMRLRPSVIEYPCSHGAGTSRGPDSWRTSPPLANSPAN